VLVEIWSDVVCPWCYLGKRRFERAAADVPFRADIEVVHRSFQLDPDAPPGETIDVVASLSGKYGLSPTRAEALQREMERRAAGDGLDYHLDGMRTGNTFDAHRLLKLGAAHGRGAELLEVLFRAYFSERRSLFDRESLTVLGLEAGLGADDVDDTLDSARYEEEVRGDLARARELGITGVPFYVFDQRLGVSGAQPTEVLARALIEAHGAD
jgi:predicted DsbA family dithiol-disulfide isomerase